MRESDTVAAMRRDLGSLLADRRKAAGYLQRELAALVGYSRTAIANAETGGSKIGRQLWERADKVLGTGELFARGFARIQARIAVESRAGAERQMSAVASAGIWGDGDVEPLTASRARQVYLDRGWPVEEDADGRLWLLTGTVIDAFAVPRPAGMVAMGWWLYSRGVPDDIRRLPALPDPAVSLAMIAAGLHCYFLTRSGAFPWTRRDTGAAAGAAPPARPVMCWHADGSRVPAPPSRLAGGEHASWAHLPAGEGQLVSPMALLHLLSRAVSTTREGASLLLPGGVRAVPAAAEVDWA